MAGGFDGHQCLQSAECFDLETKQWTELSRMSAPRSGVSIINYHGAIYAIGGFDGEGRLNSGMFKADFKLVKCLTKESVYSYCAIGIH